MDKVDLVLVETKIKEFIAKHVAELHQARQDEATGTTLPPESLPPADKPGGDAA